MARGERYWLLTLHPKCDEARFARYRALAGTNAAFVEPEAVMAAQRAADVLVADTTSLVSEFVVQHKPVVTFRNRAPKPHMLDFDEPQLDEMVGRALEPSPELRARSCGTPTPSIPTATAFGPARDRRDRGVHRRRNGLATRQTPGRASAQPADQAAPGLLGPIALTVSCAG